MSAAEFYHLISRRMFRHNTVHLTVDSPCVHDGR